MIQIAYSKIVDNNSILESKCPECCPYCLLRQCDDPDICPQPEPRVPKGNYANKERKNYNELKN